MEPIRKTREVPCAPAEASRIFTAEIERWWSRDSHALSAGEGKVALEATMQPREVVSETAYNGDTHRLGDGPGLVAARASGLHLARRVLRDDEKRGR